MVVAGARYVAIELIQALFGPLFAAASRPSCVRGNGASGGGRPRLTRLGLAVAVGNVVALYGRPSYRDATWAEQLDRCVNGPAIALGMGKVSAAGVRSGIWVGGVLRHTINGIELIIIIDLVCINRANYRC